MTCTTLPQQGSAVDYVRGNDRVGTAVDGQMKAWSKGWLLGTAGAMAIVEAPGRGLVVRAPHGLLWTHAQAVTDALLAFPAK